MRPSMSLLVPGLTLLLVATPAEEESVRAAMKAGDEAMKAEQFVQATKHYREAAQLNTRPGTLRRRAQDRRRRALTKQKKKKAAKAVAKLQKADQKLYVLHRYPKRTKRKAQEASKELEKLSADYRADGDDNFAQLAIAVRALVLARSGFRDDALEIAKNLRRAASKRSRSIAMKAQYYALAPTEDVKAAAAAAVHFANLHAETFAEPLTLYVRPPELDRACKKYDEAEGQGACAKLQLKLVDRVFLRDFSQGRRRNGQLTQADLDRVHAQVLPWLESCVLDAAREDQERFYDTDLKISWVVSAFGTPDQIKVKPSRYETDLAKCLTEVIPSFRYPRVRSQELSSVAVPYRLE